MAGGGDDALLKASTFAIDAVIAATLPGEAARIEAAKGAFCDAEDLFFAVSETAFEVGVEYGKRLAGKA